MAIKHLLVSEHSEQETQVQTKYRGINCKKRSCPSLRGLPGFSLIDLVNYSLTVLSLEGIMPHRVSCYSDNLRHCNQFPPASWLLCNVSSIISVV
jgi:hypothetical protein